MKKIHVIGLVLTALVGFGALIINMLDMQKTQGVAVVPAPTIHPVDHASFVVSWGDEVVVFDPVGAPERYLAYGTPTLVVITHAHGDHLDLATLDTLAAATEWPIVVPQVVFDQLPPALQARAPIMKNGDMALFGALTLTAVPMYNVTAGKTAFHEKGVGNGYVVERGGVRIYNASDTELTPEFAAQTGMDIALVPMNEPFTMSLDMAVEATLAIAPKKVYPYHYRGREGMTDVALFKAQVEAANPAIEVVLGDWYSVTE